MTKIGVQRMSFQFKLTDQVIIGIKYLGIYLSTQLA